MTTVDLEAEILARAAVARVKLSVAQSGQLAFYFGLLQRWNERMNLTALPLESNRAGAIDRLLMEPFVAAEQVKDQPLVCYDLGSGGGSPAVPMAVARPLLNVTMIEARGRKAAFLREVVRQLGLNQMKVLAQRFEAVAPELLRSADLVTLRAVKLDAETIKLVRGLLRPTGQFMVFGGPERLPSFRLVRTLALPGSDSRLSLFARV